MVTLLRRASLCSLLLAAAACTVAPENGEIISQDVSTYIVDMAGFTTQPSRTVQMEVLSPPNQDPFSPSSTWEPVGDPVVSSATTFGYGYNNLFYWDAAAPLSSVTGPNGSAVTWRDEGLLRLRAREVGTNTLLMTFDDVDCLIEHMGDPVLDVVAACQSPYSGVTTVLSEIDKSPQGSFLSLKENDLLVGESFYEKFGYSEPKDLKFGDWLDGHGLHLAASPVPDPVLANGDAVQAKYFNGADLGLGRHMNCRHVHADDPGEVCEGNSAGAGELLRTACYVTNYGEPGGEPDDAFEDMHDNVAGATVAMEKHYHDPNAVDCAATLASSVPAVDDVRFFVWNHLGTPPSEDDGAVVSIALDSNPVAKPAPGVCLNCHGGNVVGLYKDSVEGAKFLPFDADLFEFDDVPGGSQASQSESFRLLNEFVLDTEQEGAPDTEPASELARLIMTWYGGVPTSGDAGVRTANTSYDGDTRPAAWLDPDDPTNTYDYQHELYSDVIRPYCRMCHIAFEDNFAPADNKDITFATPQSYYDNAYIAATLACTNFAMPHAEVTSGLFWDSNARMIVVNEGGFGTDCTPYPPYLP